MDILGLDRRAVHASVEVVREATTGDLGRPTPCHGWTLADLLAHMIAQHRGFTAAAQGDGADPVAWHEHPLGDHTTAEPARDVIMAKAPALDEVTADAPAVEKVAGAVAAYAEAAEQVIAAFAVDGVLDRRFALHTVGPGFTVPAPQAIGFHFIDYLVHAWDVAQSLGVPFTPDPDLVAAARPIAEAVPDGDYRRAPGAPFQPSVAAPEDADAFAQILAMLGRNPLTAADHGTRHR